MTNAQPEDLTIRVDRVEARLDNLVDIARSLVQNAEIQQQNIAQLSVQTTRNANAIERLTTTTESLASEAAQDRQQAAIDRQEFRDGINRILQYLSDRNGGSTPPA